MAWPKRDVKYISVPIYDQDVYIFRTEKAFQRAIEHLGMVGDFHLGSGGTAIQCENENTGEQVFLILITLPTMQVLVHEIAHVTFDILKHVGVSAYHDEQEPFCYLLDHIFEESWEFIHGYNPGG